MQGSAVGYYGAGDEELDESSPSGSDMLAVICRECEEASAGLEGLSVGASCSGPASCSPRERRLKVMTPLFKLGPGTPIGGAGKFLAAGNQWMSWIHIHDIVGLFRLAIENGNARGPLNGTAPEPVRNADFARTFSSVLRKPYTPWRVFLPVGPPDALLRLMVGEVASVITTGQRVLPRKALELGYHFKYQHLAEALRDVVEHIAPKPAAPAPHACGGGEASLARHRPDQKARRPARHRTRPRSTMRTIARADCGRCSARRATGSNQTRILGPDLHDHRAVRRHGLRLGGDGPLLGLRCGCDRHRSRPRGWARGRPDWRTRREWTSFSA